MRKRSWGTNQKGTTDHIVSENFEQIVRHNFTYQRKRKDPVGSFEFMSLDYQPIAGAVRATGVDLAAARSRGKL